MSSKERCLKAARDHGDLIKGILDDYLVTDGAELEIAQALTNLVIAIKSIKVEEEEKPELTADQVIEKAKELYENDEITSHDLLQFLVDDEVADYAKGKGFAYIKVATMDQQEKLRQFAETEIWPDINQHENIMI